MDERLEKALDISNYMVTLNNQKRLLNEQYKENLVYYHGGGQFTVTKELISFCQTLISMDQFIVILIDDNNIPIEINDLDAFKQAIVSQYFEASNQYLAEYSKLKSQRSVESIIDLWAKVFYYSHLTTKV